MPQEGTEAYLYFPEAQEGSAYAVSGIHNSSCPVFADARSRGLVTEHGKKLQLYAGVLGFAGGKEETVQECRMGEDGIHFGAGKGKLQVTGREQIILREQEIALDAVQIIGVGFLDTSKFILLTGFVVAEARSFGRFQVIVSG